MPDFHSKGRTTILQRIRSRPATDQRHRLAQLDLWSNSNNHDAYAANLQLSYIQFQYFRSSQLVPTARKAQMPVLMSVRSHTHVINEQRTWKWGHRSRLLSEPPADMSTAGGDLAANLRSREVLHSLSDNSTSEAEPFCKGV